LKAVGEGVEDEGLADGVRAFTEQKKASAAAVNKAVAV
jgi:hypothetical protein